MKADYRLRLQEQLVLTIVYGGVSIVGPLECMLNAHNYHTTTAGSTLKTSAVR